MTKVSEGLNQIEYFMRENQQDITLRVDQIADQTSRLVGMTDDRQVAWEQLTRDLMSETQRELAEERQRNEDNEEIVKDLKLKLEMQTEVLKASQEDNQREFRQLASVLGQMAQSLDEKMQDNENDASLVKKREKVRSQQKALEKVIWSSQQAGMSIEKTAKQVGQLATASQVTECLTQLDQKLKMVGRSSKAKIFLRDSLRFGKGVGRGAVNNLRKAWDNIEVNATKKFSIMSAGAAFTLKAPPFGGLPQFLEAFVEKPTPEQRENSDEAEIPEKDAVMIANKFNPSRPKIPAVPRRSSSSVVLSPTSIPTAQTAQFKEDPRTSSSPSPGRLSPSHSPPAYSSPAHSPTPRTLPMTFSPSARIPAAASRPARPPAIPTLSTKSTQDSPSGTSSSPPETPPTPSITYSLMPSIPKEEEIRSASSSAPPTTRPPLPAPRRSSPHRFSSSTSSIGPPSPVSTVPTQVRPSPRRPSSSINPTISSAPVSIAPTTRRPSPHRPTSSISPTLSSSPVSSVTTPRRPSPHRHASSMSSTYSPSPISISPTSPFLEGKPVALHGLGESLQRLSSRDSAPTVRSYSPQAIETKNVGDFESNIVLRYKSAAF